MSRQKAFLECARLAAALNSRPRTPDALNEASAPNPKRRPAAALYTYLPTQTFGCWRESGVPPFAPATALQNADALREHPSKVREVLECGGEGGDTPFPPTVRKPSRATEARKLYLDNLDYRKSENSYQEQSKPRALKNGSAVKSPGLIR